MAADTRQFADHFELDGSNVYMEDKKLGELKDKTAVTTIDATNQFIPLQDVDGNIQKISKSSFTDAVRNVLGDLLINNDKGVSISGIPALSGSGSSLDFGSVSPANLASVLGVNMADVGEADNSIEQLVSDVVTYTMSRTIGIYSITGWWSGHNGNYSGIVWKRVDSSNYTIISGFILADTGTYSFVNVNGTTQYIREISQ